MVNQRRSARRNYDRASTTDDNRENNDEELPSSSAINNNDDNNNDDKVTKDGVGTIQIQILDSAQNRFTIPSITPTICTVQQLKDIGCAIHGVSPPQQRLIYMGKLLNDDTSLLSVYGIVKDLCIVHLFPKPTVVIDRSRGSAEDTSLCTPAPGDNGPNSDTGTETAHIPRIVLDASEAERHSNVIILSSHEAFEILHRVRLCAFCLLVYSSMEILQDLTLWMGNFLSDSGGTSEGFRPDEPTDTTEPAVGDGMVWESWNYIDGLISICSFYVAMLGIKVTTEHELGTARLFWHLLVLLSFVWNGFYYWNTVRMLKNEREKGQDSRENMDDDFDDTPSIDFADSNLEEMGPYNLALWYMSFVVVLWLVFIFWARQFKCLMEEAGAEAEERTRSLTNVTALNASGYGGADSGEVVDIGASVVGGSAGVTEGGGDSDRGGVYDLELQVEGRAIT